MKVNHSKITSPVGDLHLASNGEKLVAVIFANGWKDFVKDNGLILEEKKDTVLVKTEKQLHEYFKGERTDFDIPLELNGTDFQTKAWKGLLTIPFGTTVSYSDQAKKIKNPAAVRAIGAANGQNKICIIVPCHRVIGKNGSLTGFGGGIEIKRQLLEFEAQQLTFPLI